MIPIRLVFLIVGISMILSSAVFGGESPNDRIDTLLSLMTGMSERVDKLVKNVAKIKTKVDNIEDEMVEVKSDVSSMSSKINGVEKKVSTIETDVAEVKERVGWKFVGMGGAATADDEWTYGTGHTLAGCIGRCTNIRSSDSKWNGMRFDPSGGWCWCMKNDVGHDPSFFKDWMHFKC